MKWTVHKQFHTLFVSV